MYGDYEEYLLSQEQEAEWVAKQEQQYWLDLEHEALWQHYCQEHGWYALPDEYYLH